MDISTIALAGVQRAEFQVEKAARQIAAAGTPDSEREPIDAINLSHEMVLLLSAREQLQVNAKSVHVAQDLQRRFIDMQI
jgi:hypothetical protein